jgi:hypothetical protein
MVRRVLREVVIENKGIRRFICSECLWDTEIKAPTAQSEAEQEFALHFCESNRRRSSLT